MFRIVTTIVVLAATGLAGAEAQAGKKVAMLLFSSESRYIEGKERTLAALRQAGFVEPETTFVIENAEGNKTKAADLAKKIGATPYDLVVVFGTSATVPMAKEVKTSPIVFGHVYDPVEAKIVADWRSSGNNVTGVSNKAAMSAVLAPLKKIGTIKTLAVLYTPGEKNSEIQLKELQRAQGEAGLTVVAVPVSKAEELRAVVGEAAAGNDALYVTGSGILGAEVAAIVDVTSKAGKPTLTHLEDQVVKGVLFGVSINSAVMGDKTGELCVRVLKGEKPSSLPILVPDKVDVVLNTKTAKAYKLPAAFMSLVTKKVE